jgi:hypothetical protein
VGVSSRPALFFGGTAGPAAAFSQCGTPILPSLKAAMTSAQRIRVWPSGDEARTPGLWRPNQTLAASITADTSAGGVAPLATFRTAAM